MEGIKVSSKQEIKANKKKKSYWRFAESKEAEGWISIKLNLEE